MTLAWAFSRFLYTAGAYCMHRYTCLFRLCKTTLLGRQVASRNDLHTALSVLIMGVTPGSLRFPLTPFIQVGTALSRSSRCLGASLQPPSTTSNPEQIIPSPCTLSLAVGTVQPAVGQFPSIIKQVQTSHLGWHRVIYEDGYHSILLRYFLHCEINWFSFSSEWCWESNPASHIC